MGFCVFAPGRVSYFRNFLRGMETSEAARMVRSSPSFRNFLRGMETGRYGPEPRPALPSETSLEGWKPRGGDIGGVSLRAFRNFLRGMETLLRPSGSLPSATFRNFLRGMETTNGGAEAPRYFCFRNFLRGMETRKHCSSVHWSATSETSLEGWKQGRLKRGTIRTGLPKLP